jgi:hypothetical protein
MVLDVSLETQAKVVQAKLGHPRKGCKMVTVSAKVAQPLGCGFEILGLDRSRHRCETVKDIVDLHGTFAITDARAVDDSIVFDNSIPAMLKSCLDLQFKCEIANPIRDVAT